MGAMRILGIHDGHLGTACYLEEGNIKTSVSEERFTRNKGQGGFPSQAVRYIFEAENIGPRDLHKIALVGLLKPLVSIDQYQSGRQWFFPHIIRFFPGDPRWLIRKYVALGTRKRLKEQTLLSELRDLDLEIQKVEIVEHHQAHAASAYYASPFRQNGKKTLVVTLDGSGDGLSGTVSIVDQEGTWKRLQDISTFDSLGMLYSRVTQYLGMKPWEHEYKLMGMAPYVAELYAAKVLDVLEQYMGLNEDGLGFRNKTRSWGNSLLARMHKDLRTHRFDAISAGVQMLHEKMVVALLRNWIRKTGIRQLALGGGCFMNVKANKLIAEMDECDDLFIMPSCGDESCSIGAAIWSYIQHDEKAKDGIKPLEHLYWGPEYSESEILEAIKEWGDEIGWRKSEDIEKESARLLTEHCIIGRMWRKMEWGARALGNRSILANPSRPQDIRKLNAAVKMRDFWMPFAPSILWERRRDYAVFRKEVDSYYMTMAYDSTSLARDQMLAALHPYDLTMRPQFIKKEHNPEYHRLVSEFEKLTGIGGILNTSFNMHGWPIVCSPQDALRTLMHSHLDYITLNDYLVWKKHPSL